MYSCSLLRENIRFKFRIRCWNAPLSFVKTKTTFRSVLYTVRWDFRDEFWLRLGNSNFRDSQLVSLFIMFRGVIVYLKLILIARWNTLCFKHELEWIKHRFIFLFHISTFQIWFSFLRNKWYFREFTWTHETIFIIK